MVAGKILLADDEFGDCSQMGQWFCWNLCVGASSLFAKYFTKICKRDIVFVRFFVCWVFFSVKYPEENETQFRFECAQKGGFSIILRPLREDWIEIDGIGVESKSFFGWVNRITILIFHIIYHAMAFALASSDFDVKSGHFWIAGSFGSFAGLFAWKLEANEYCIQHKINMCLCFSSVRFDWKLGSTFCHCLYCWVGVRVECVCECVSVNVVCDWECGALSKMWYRFVWIYVNGFGLLQ